MSAVTVHFYTLPFFQELARRLSADETWGRQFQGREVRLVCSAPDVKRAFLLEVHDGAVRASEATADTKADFRLEGPYDSWVRVCKGEAEVEKLVLAGKIRVAGSMPDLMRMMGPLNHMVLMARTFPKEF